MSLYYNSLQFNTSGECNNVLHNVPPKVNYAYGYVRLG